MNFYYDEATPAPGFADHSAQTNSPFMKNVSAYFQRPTKITKPSSRNTSPRTSTTQNGVRRRPNTTAFPISRTRSVFDKKQQVMKRQFAALQPNRPVSWHPASYNEYNNIYDTVNLMPYTTPYQQLFMNGTTAVNGTYTPMTYPVADEPQIQELITPLEGLSAQEYSPTDEMYAPKQPYWMSEGMLGGQYYNFDGTFQQNPMQYDGQWDMQLPIQNMPTAPASPAFLPIQGGNEASPLSLDAPEIPVTTDGEELVGMGLYDSPADVQCASFLFNRNGIPSRKRSLKLEESFQPSLQEEEDKGSDDSEEDAESEQDAESQHLPIFQNHQPTTQENEGLATLAGQSFFFDAGQDTMGMGGMQNRFPAEQYLMSSGLPAQGVGYGWL